VKALLPRGRFVENTRTHYVLAETKHFVRYMLLDKEGHALMNHTSIVSDVAAQPSGLASVLSLDEAYDKRLISFGQKTGTVYVTVRSTGYHFQNLHPKKGGLFGGSSGSSSGELARELTDQMQIEVVRPVEIEPRYKSIYFLGQRNTQRFNLTEGSGHFSVTLNDTSLASVQHSGGRDLVIVPKNQGVLEITVEDVEIPESVAVSATLLISDIWSLHLESEGYLIQQGDSLNMTVTAFDVAGSEFDADQYPKMDFALETEMTDVSGGGILAQKVRGELRVFKVTGVEPGNYVLTAYTQAHQADRAAGVSTTGRRITSDANKIEVFSILRLHPGTLLLTPNMRYTLSTTGGPSRGSYGSSIEGSQVEVSFQIADPSVASIDQVKEITAKQVGDTSLSYSITQTKQSRDGRIFKSTVSRKTVPIRVRLVSYIEIPANQQRIVYTGSMLKQLAVLKYKNETGDERFSHGVAPISWDWNCSNPDILRPHFPSEEEGSQQHHFYTKVIRDNDRNSNNAVFSTAFNSSSIHARAVTAGEAVLQVRMAIEYPEAYKYKTNWFDTKRLVKVQDRLSVAVPEFMTDADKSTHLFLLPPHSRSKIITNRQAHLRLGYSMQSIYDTTTQKYKLQESRSPIISLESDQAIRTHDKYGKVTVIAEEPQAFSDQVVMLNIFITDIYTLSAHNFNEALSLPLGGSITIPLKFYNEHAHLFATNIEGIHVGTELSHPSVVSAELDAFNSTVTLRSVGSGECNVVLYLVNNPAIFDVLRVKVATLVQPSAPVYVHVGGEIAFKVMKDGPEPVVREGITWSSDQPSVLDIDAARGTAKAKKEGKAEIRLSNSPNAVSIVHVSQVKHAELDSQSHGNLVLNVDDRNDLIRPRVKLFLSSQNVELLPITQYDGVTLIRQSVEMKCESDQPEHLETRAEVSEIEGYFCLVRFIGTSHRNYQDIKREAKITVTVAPATSQGQRVYQQEVLTFEIKLVSNLYVEDRHQRGAALGMHTRTRSVKVLSLADFTVNSTASTLQLEVMKQSDAFKPNQYNITLNVPRTVNQRFSTTLKLTNQATGAVTNLAVRFDPSDVREKPRAKTQESETGWAAAPSSSESRGQEPKFKTPKEERTVPG
jgi:hypothetical protein